MYQGGAGGLLTCMTPHPLATWVQMSVSPQREANRKRRRRRAVRHLARTRAVRTTEPAPDAAAPSTPRIPAQRRPASEPATHL